MVGKGKRRTTTKCCRMPGERHVPKVDGELAAIRGVY